jgi:2-oxoglutarate dehydrogenase E2 component (dihydrolipoamide succinyltransferase)
MPLLDIRAPEEQEGSRSQVLRWVRRPGEAVLGDEPLVELETDKVTVEVASPGTGVLREILKAEGEELAPGDVLGRVETSAAGEHTEGRGAPAPRSPAVATAATPESIARSAAVSRHRSSLSPAVKRLLAERGLDASQVRGTGEGGRVTVDDVLEHAIARPPMEPALARESDQPAGNVRRVPHTPMRSRVAEHMVESLLRTSPHVTSIFEADMGAVIAHRAQHRDAFEREGVPLTLTAYFLRACVAAIRAVPEANSRWTETALEIFERIDIGVATALDGGGLIVPVLRNVQDRSFEDIARGLADLVARARVDALQPADVRGGTFTVSNHGVSGSLIATPIVINQPQSAILGIGRLEKRPVVDAHDRIVARPRCYVTLTIDHRVMDGLQANRFLLALIECLETPFDGVS